MSTVQADIKGGLGNQLFIVATLLSFSVREGVPYKLKKVKTQTVTPRPMYWDTVFHRLTFTDKLPSPEIEITESTTFCIEGCSPRTVEYWDRTFHRKPVEPGMIKEPTHLVLNDYFQSYSKYFPDLDIHSYFALPAPLQSIVDEKVKTIQTKHLNQPLVSIHVRRGDYVQYAHLYHILGENWYKKALRHFDIHANTFLIFSEDKDREWAKHVFSYLPHVEFIQETDYIELFMMSQCDEAIIANSTFSWWGAMLGKRKHRVLCPKQWYKVSKPPSPNRLEWIAIDI
jgi:hypothetical protein